MTRVGAEVTAGRKPKLQVTKFQCNGKTSVSTVPDINPEYTRGLVNIEPDILATTGYAICGDYYNRRERFIRV